MTDSISVGVLGLIKLLIWFWLNFGKWYLLRKLSVSFSMKENIIQKQIKNNKFQKLSSDQLYNC